MAENGQREVQHNSQNGTTSFEKLRLLMWKNFLIQLRHPIRTLFEIIFFALFWAIIYYIKFGMNGVLIVLSFMFPVGNAVRYITSEKESQLKEAMIIMGIPRWLHWIGWFMRIMIFMIIAISICVAVLKVHLATSISVLWVFLFIYSISLTTYSFMMSSFFARASMSSIFAMVGWFALVLPYFFVMQSTSLIKYISSISSNSALMEGAQVITLFEIKNNNGIKWSNIWDKVDAEYTESRDFSLGIVMLFLLGTSLLYLLIALYVEKVFPGNYGVPEKWYFPLTKEFWCGIRSDTENTDDIHILSNPNFEKGLPNSRIGIKIKNLRKMYANKNVAVNGVTLDIFDDQITILLGANGAGKTTVMSMLSGWIAPTAGTAILNGHNIRKNLQKARSSIGYCPQHNILFDELTVREHIEFYGQLKGLNKISVKQEVQKYVQQLELAAMIDKTAQSLSGGMKRKLSVVIALCGKSNVVFLDEPSSGLDPTARRNLWNLLQAERKGRTILMTTHFMDEADALGDRIAIMAKGELKCYGTPFFLKARFGSGYRVICAKDDNCNVNAVTATLREFIPGVDVHENIAREFTYVLPVEYVDKFQTIFEKLEQNQHDLGISSFGVSLTPLEEIFLKISSDIVTTDTNLQQQNSLGTSDVELASTPLLSGLSFHLNQWHAMFKKRFICWKRRWIVLILQNILTPLTAFLVILSAKPITDSMTASLVVNVYALAFAFTSNFYIMFYIRERASKAKFLQFVSGLNIFTYWMTSFLFDYILFVIMGSISIIPFCVYQFEKWIDISALFVTILIYGFSLLPMIYVASFLFKSPSAGLNTMAIYLPVIMNFVFSLAYAMQRDPESQQLLQRIFLILPSYSLLNACYKLSMYGRAPIEFTYSWNENYGILVNFAYLVAVGVVFFAILAIIEVRTLSKLSGKLNSKTKSHQRTNDIDDDVLEEKKHVDAMTKNELQTTNLVLRKLTKKYGRFVAVNEMSIAVKSAECFGLLGINGAGKTSTFKMITGDTKISDGDAFVQGISLKSDMLKVNKIIGYCPQFDALLDDLTGTETLEIFALLRGVRSSDIHAVIERFANELNFKIHLGKKISEYSGGNKRKLSTAIALIGNPVVVYLDEPSSGMDAGAKRNMWKLLSKVRSSGKSIVLTSHSMEECEALCTRLAIMVNGELKCLGSTQHLKNKFSKGFWLTIKIMNIDVINTNSMEVNTLKIKSFVNGNFIGAELKEEYQGLLKYYIPPSELKWSSMFGTMEIAKRTLPIEDYSISQTTLEQVFLSLTKLQEDRTNNN